MSLINGRFRESAPFGKGLGLLAGQPCQFALQPIVEPSEGKISSLEALIRGNDGGSPEHFFRSLDREQIYEVDLQTKAGPLRWRKSSASAATNWR